MNQGNLSSHGTSLYRFIFSVEPRQAYKIYCRAAVTDFKWLGRFFFKVNRVIDITHSNSVEPVGENIIKREYNVSLMFTYHSER